MRPSSIICWGMWTKKTWEPWLTLKRWFLNGLVKRLLMVTRVSIVTTKECGSKVYLITLRKLFVIMTTLLYGAWVYLRSTDERNTSVTTLIQIQSVIVTTCINVHDLNLKKKTQEARTCRQVSGWNTEQHTQISSTVFEPRPLMHKIIPARTIHLLAHFSKVRGSNPSTSGTCTPGTSTPLTPKKVAQLRWMYIQQIKELHDLRTCGAITNDHFVKQRDLLLEQMTKI